jgi:IS1 family transposase
LRVIYGDEKEVLALFGKSTVYVERAHLTMRLFNGRLARKTLAFSKLLLPDSLAIFGLLKSY